MRRATACSSRRSPCARASRRPRRGAARAESAPPPSPARVLLRALRLEDRRRVFTLLDGANRILVLLRAVMTREHSSIHRRPMSSWRGPRDPSCRSRSASSNVAARRPCRPREVPFPGFNRLITRSRSSSGNGGSSASPRVRLNRRLVVCRARARGLGGLLVASRERLFQRTDIAALALTRL